MKYCSNCGKELNVGDNVCSNCGNVINKTITTENNKTKTDGFAIAGFVLSLVSLFCCGSTSILGLVFSIVGLSRTNKSNTNGKGLAIAGIVISAVFLLIFIIIYSLGLVTSVTKDIYYNSYYY